jgi:CheY-like chemotaxis protein
VSIVLYVDDEPVLCRVFERVLRRTGADVRTFTDPEAALAFLDEHPVAAVVCDYRMPGMTGLEVLERVSEGVPFFLVSGDLGITERVADLPRVTGVFAKPFQPEALLSRLSTFLED